MGEGQEPLSQCNLEKRGRGLPLNHPLISTCISRSPFSSYNENPSSVCPWEWHPRGTDPLPHPLPQWTRELEQGAGEDSDSPPSPDALSHLPRPALRWAALGPRGPSPDPCPLVGHPGEELELFSQCWDHSCSLRDVGSEDAFSPASPLLARLE